VDPHPRISFKKVEEAMGAGYAFDGFGIGYDMTGPLEALILAKDEEAAANLEAALRPYLSEMAKAVRGKRPVVGPKSARSEAHRRAWRALALTRTGKELTLKTSVALNREELAALDAEKPRYEAIARIIQALIDKQQPSKADVDAAQREPEPARYAFPKPKNGKTWELDDLKRIGVTKKGELLCGFDPSSCVCHEELKRFGDCITLEENLKVFRAALEPGQLRTVSCARAEVGRCGAYRYFYFQGDIHRYELRFFGADGKLVAQRNTTDYDAYCGGASARWQGVVPACNEMKTEELICGKAPRPLVPPLEDLRRLMRTAYELP
jgi:hypothetical protein